MNVDGSTQVRIANISIAGYCRPIDTQHLRSLKSSLHQLGQLVPITVFEHGLLVDGRHRLEAAKELGWDSIRVTVISDPSVFGAEIAFHVNGVRKPMTSRDVHTYVELFNLSISPPSRQLRWEPLEMTCEGCRTCFTPKGPNNRFCSPRCRSEAHRANRAVAKIEEAALMARRTCVGCGETLAGRSIRARFCAAKCRTRTWKKNQ